MLAFFKGLSLVRRIVVFLVVLGLAVGGYMAIMRFFTANLKTENKLNRGLGEAAMESGGDAVGTVSNRAASEAGQLKTVEEQNDEIRNQADAGSITRLGRRGLCDRRPDRRGCGELPRPPAK
jgi:hypothetical protein